MILKPDGKPFEGFDAWAPKDGPGEADDDRFVVTSLNDYEERITAGFLAAQRAEIDGLYEALGVRISEGLFGVPLNWTPYAPPKRWSAQWWRAKWYAVRSRIVGVRRRVGLWIGGIDPSELEHDY